ncbi:DNA polymerase I [Oscillatoriales cyanobacterium LEGE 11467]|uniref:DNA polymerase I n=1 Tax=Zarconia navalis LEGE 11467 TaxID=1828826 RepID=A0A928VXQ2_9CYAN|nr:DNA polymerase I [Zarconia navalis]MBE9041534.1 DNA polymerase I [Zarconia navalis LEGE 11467]
MSANPTFLLIDGHSLAFRAYYAFAKSREGGLRTSKGVPTSVCFGFLKSLLETIETHKPEYVAIAFDTKTPTFRHEADPNYKANRSETPEDFIPDIQNLQELLKAFDFTVLTAPGYEADDILGTLSRVAADASYSVKILSGDRDLFQLVDAEKEISVLYTSGSYGKRNNASKPEEFTPEGVLAKLKVLPEKVVDYKALCGDASDNIPGVSGIGPKTAVKLLAQYGSLDGIYEAIDGIKGANQKKLVAGKDAAYRSQFLAEIKQDIPMELELESCQLKGFSEEKVIPALKKLELTTFVNNITQLQGKLGGTAAVETTPEKIAPDEDNDTWFFSAEETETAQQPEAVPIQVQIIQTEAQLAELVERLKTYTHRETPVAWDTETTALEPRDAELVGIGCCWGTGEADVAYIPIGHKIGQNLPLETALEGLREILESPAYPKSLQNAKFDRLILRHQGIELAGVAFDTMLASYVLNPENTHNLADLSLRYLGITAQSYQDLVPKGKTIADLAIPAVANYCGMDVYTTFGLVEKLRAELAAVPKLEKLLLEVEQPLEPVLADMESRGICIDTAYLQELSGSLAVSLQQIETQAYDMAGEEFNLGSPKQLSQLLFEKLELDKRKTRKTKTGYSTNAAVLEKLQGDHPIVDNILEYRTLSKLKSTYVDALPALVREDTGRVHTDFNQTVTATGRLSSSNPNLQNIPIRTEFSRQIRKAFVPKEGWILAAADYSQIELRILAHLSQEPVLIEAYQNNRDVHRLTAQLLFEKEDVTPDERRLGKTINFGVIYGMGAQRFAREAGFSVVEGREFIERYNDRYAKVFEYLQQMKREAIANGYVETILGRRRYFEFESGSLRKLKDSDPKSIDLDKIKNIGQFDAQSLRAAANAPIQGSSADIIKIAMVKLHEVLQDYQGQLLLQVHDELVLEIPPEEWEELQPIVGSTMEEAIALSVPLVVDVGTGRNWMETK